MQNIMPEEVNWTRREDEEINEDECQILNEKLR